MQVQSYFLFFCCAPKAAASQICISYSENAWTGTSAPQPGCSRTCIVMACLLDGPVGSSAKRGCVQGDLMRPRPLHDYRKCLPLLGSRSRPTRKNELTNGTFAVLLVFLLFHRALQHIPAPSKDDILCFETSCPGSSPAFIPEISM